MIIELCTYLNPMETLYLPARDAGWTSIARVDDKGSNAARMDRSDGTVSIHLIIELRTHVQRAVYT